MLKLSLPEIDDWTTSVVILYYFSLSHNKFRIHYECASRAHVFHSIYLNAFTAITIIIILA